KGLRRDLARDSYATVRDTLGNRHTVSFRPRRFFAKINDVKERSPMSVRPDPIFCRGKLLSRPQASGSVGCFRANSVSVGQNRLDGLQKFSAFERLIDDDIRPEG